jgi:hypothetical protein
LYIFFLLFILYAVPAEAAVKDLSNVGTGFFALLAGVVVITVLLKKFMG